ncbi:hypothetical protein [Leucobacter musarum]|uniref:hypothetical protein n=1 Tax=Leucobacter musarum TaxID=1930747 RepID=UPI0006A798BC|nr:hypothetical protein [Leucobacter musarum]
MNHTKKFAKIAALAAIPLLLAGLAGCSPSADENASSNTPNSSSSTGSGPNASGEYEKWYLGFAKCMREKGIDVPDTPESSMSISADAPYIKASEECTEKVGAAPGRDAGSEEENNEAMRKMAQCYREKGYDVADPQPGQAGQIPDAPQNVIDECLAASGN